MVQTLFHGSLCVPFQPFMGFQGSQRCHGSDTELLFCFFYDIQVQSGQVNGCTDIAVSHFQPDHTAKYAGGFLLI